MNRMHQLSTMIEEHRDGIIALCSDLIKISSENPPGHTLNIVHFVEEYLKREGINCRIYAPVTAMPNVLAHVRGAGPGRRLIYNGHLDTFPVGDSEQWTTKPLGGQLIEDKIFGRGASDMKGGVTASIMAFLILSRFRKAFHGEIVLTLVSDEETGGAWGTKWLLDHVPEVTGDAVINGEPTSCAQVSFAEKGRLFLEFEARGKGAHGAYTHIGVNAIQMMMKLLLELSSLIKLDIVIPNDIRQVLEQERAVIDNIKGDGTTDALLGITVNFGTIHGGLNVNTIPENCQAQVDIRLPQGVSCQQIKKEVDLLMKRHPGISYQILQAIEPNYTPPDHEICQLLREKAEFVRGGPVILGSSIGGSDVKHFRKRGIPCAVYGPMSYNMAGSDEHITVEDLIITAKAHALASLAYLGCAS